MPVEGTPFTPRHYGSELGMVAELGPFNESVYKDRDSDGNAATMANAAEASLAGGDVEVNAYLGGGGVSIPVSTTDTNYAMVVRAANKLSAHGLAVMRGVAVDAGGRPLDNWQNLVSDAKKLLDSYAAITSYGGYTPSAPSSGEVSFSNRACLERWC